MIRLIKPFTEYSEVESDFKEIFKSGWFSKGNYNKKFVKDLSSYLDVKYCHLATSATTALWASLKMMGIGEGDKVLVSDYSFPASVNVIEDVGATPVFVDVDLGTYNMDASDLEAKISEDVKAVMFVDTFGNPSGLKEVKEICESHRIPLIEDAACVIGSRYQEKKCGSIADVTCFSFHPRKLLTTGEGGAITTDNEEYNDWLSVKLQHGASQGVNGLEFRTYGYNFRMTELQAAMGIAQLPKLDEVILYRIGQYSIYKKALEPLGFRCQALRDSCYSNRQSAVFTVPEGISRDGLIQGLRAKGVESTIGTYSQSNEPYYLKKYKKGQPNALYLYRNSISLPCYQGLDVEPVISAILELT